MPRPIPAARRGFTLIESSVVLVVIGMLIGGILVGQEMAAAAQLRGGLRQLEQYNSAVNTFKLKYACLPGDCPYAARQLGFVSSFAYGDTRWDGGNGNGLIIDSIQSNASTFATSKSGSSTEAWNFWMHLGRAQLIEGTYRGGGGYGLTIASNGSVLFTNSPEFKAPSAPGRPPNAHVWVWPYAGSHHWTFATYCSCGHNFASQTFRPSVAGQIDAKIDDGRPMSGTVLATGDGDTYGADENPGWNNPWSSATAGNGGACVLTATSPPTYNIGRTSGSACNLTIKTSF